jgi:hypothetical protein
VAGFRWGQTTISTISLTLALSLFIFLENADIEKHYIFAISIEEWKTEVSVGSSNGISLPLILLPCRHESHSKEHGLDSLLLPRIIKRQWQHFVQG